MSELVEMAKQHVASLMEDLTGEEDFMPFMNIRTHDGMIAYVGLEMPEGGEARNRLGDVMMALCAIHRATEVVYVSTSWLVKRNLTTDPIGDDETPERPAVMPSEHPDRIEVVAIMAISGERLEGSTACASVTRENNTVRLSDWDDAEGVGIAGRFGNAIIAGMKFGEKIPPDMCAYVDAEIAAGRQDELIRLMLRALNSVRTGAFKN